MLRFLQLVPKKIYIIITRLLPVLNWIHFWVNHINLVLHLAPMWCKVESLRVGFSTCRVRLEPRISGLLGGQTGWFGRADGSETRLPKMTVRRTATERQPRCSSGWLTLSLGDPRAYTSTSDSTLKLVIRFKKSGITISHNKKCS